MKFISIYICYTTVFKKVKIKWFINYYQSLAKYLTKIISNKIYSYISNLLLHLTLKNICNSFHHCSKMHIDKTQYVIFVVQYILVLKKKSYSQKVFVNTLKVCKSYTNRFVIYFRICLMLKCGEQIIIINNLQNILSSQILCPNTVIFMHIYAA